jgi:hypothetical protein
VSDTSADARRHLDLLLRRMTPAEKFRRVLALGEVARSLAVARMSAANPELRVSELNRCVAIDLLPPELARAMRERDERRRSADGRREIE